jgi:hypothetical protein
MRAFQFLSAVLSARAFWRCIAIRVFGEQHAFIVIDYTAYALGSDYVRTINKDFRYVADLLSKSGVLNTSSAKGTPR